MATHSLIWLLWGKFLLQLMSKVNAKVPAIIVFGDSTVDSGNNNQISTILKSDFAPYGRDFEGGKPTGRFSNGRIAPDFISEAFGIKPAIPAYLDPGYSIRDFATGVCFASAGTGFDNATSDVLVSGGNSVIPAGINITSKPCSRIVSVIPLWMEVEYYKDYQKKLRRYLGVEKANKLLSEALYLISIGTNDFLENYYAMPGGRSTKFSVQEYQNFILGIAKDFITELYHLGARKIAVTGLPPMGCLPLERTINILDGGNCIEEYNHVAKEFNGKLNGIIVELNEKLPGTNLVLLSPYDLVLEIIHKPNSFGFESAAIACCGTGLFEMSYLCNRKNPFTCPDANKYVFWDAFHPTERTNAIVADYAVKNGLAQFFA